jgi:conjugative transfer signal peptidase TraF
MTKHRFFLPSLIICAMALIAWGGPRWNPSESMPRGLYWLVPGSAQRGDIVEVCPPAPVAHYAREHGIVGRGLCAGWNGTLLKVLAGVAGDDVDFESRGVYVNGLLWPQSAPRPIVAPFRAHGRHRLRQGEIVVLGLNPRSYDSRYYGAIPAASIVGRAFPLFTSHNGDIQR